MLIIKKHRHNCCNDNKGVNITDNTKGRIGFNFNQEVTDSLPEYIVLGYDGNKLYFIRSTVKDGYKVSKKDGGTGRIAVTANDDAKLLKKFKGNHPVKYGIQGLFIEIKAADNYAR